MGRRKLMLILKPFNVLPTPLCVPSARFPSPLILQHLENRVQVHKNTISLCQNVLRRKLVDWKAIFCNDLAHPIRDVDMVITVGGDGTLLRARHFMDLSVPVLAVNSDPTLVHEVEEYKDEFDATRSIGYLCAATVKNFEQVLDDILENRANPSEIARISIGINSEIVPTNALNDLLIAHPCPASVSRFAFRIRKDSEPGTPVNCRSSGLRVSTAAGSTAAMLSAGGFTMPALSKDLQYMVREPISPNSRLMHGLVKSDQTMKISWFTKEGVIYIDGSHVSYPVRYGDTIKLSSRGPCLKIFLPHHLLCKEEHAKS